MGSKALYDTNPYSSRYMDHTPTYITRFHSKVSSYRFFLVASLFACLLLLLLLKLMADRQSWIAWPWPELTASEATQLSTHLPHPPQARRSHGSAPIPQPSPRGSTPRRGVVHLLHDASGREPWRGEPA